MTRTSTRSTVLWFVGFFLAAVVVLPVGALAAEARAAKAQAEYAGHRALVWAFDPQKPGDVRGFAEATIKPDTRQTLEPAKGHSIEFTLGPIGRTQFEDDGGRAWVERTVTLKAAHGSGHSETTLDLTSPRVSVEYPHTPKWPLASVAVLVPVGTVNGAATRDLAGGNFAGEAGELEDLLIAGAVDGHLDAGTVAEAMGIVGKTARKEQWAALMNGDDGSAVAAASAALAHIGDADGQARFAKVCLEAKGNEQVALLNVLAAMPPSAVLMEAMVDLLVADHDEYRIRIEGGGVADMDRRYSLLRAMGKSPPELLAPHAARLRKWAKGSGKQLAQQVEEVLDAGVH